MSTSVLNIVIIFSVIIWIGVSQEAVKPTEKVSWRKLITLMGLGSLLTAVTVITLFKDIPFLI